LREYRLAPSIHSDPNQLIAIHRSFLWENSRQAKVPDLDQSR
jgi:hypothetical protein